ncbi:MAG: hypothetical protein ABI811_05155 [Acidobacteriota bacterium]
MKLAVLLFAALPFAALAAPPIAPDPAVDRLLDQIFTQEQRFVDSLRAHTPLFETYIQESPSAEAAPDALPSKDHYFLGRVRVSESVGYEPLIERATVEPDIKTNRLSPLRSKAKIQPMTFLPRGFAQMSILDLNGFSRTNYRLEYVRREFLGDVRALVFDVIPVRQEPGRFLGRIWVEERNHAIVRFNGTYLPAPIPKNTPPEMYFHFDSWRTNAAVDQWIPAHIYVEEERPTTTAGVTTRFKAQTRIWDYAAAPVNKLDELTQILIEDASEVKDQTVSRDVSPLESQRAWERQAEENVLARLEKGGLLAPPGPVDEVLNTVVNNLIITGKLSVDARCRVLLTTPLETFSIGHTIVISRGLIDVLPDETSLALVLAAELSHIALAHRTPTQFAFNNQTMLSDAELLARLRFERTPRELDEAGQKTIEIMRASPYQKTGNAGLFLKALASRSAALPRLLAANLGNQLANEKALQRLEEFTAAAPDLEEGKLDQIAALPLGSRIKLNPWSDQITLIETKPVSLLSAREKMPFEVAPFVPYLTFAAVPATVTPAAIPVSPPSPLQP